MNPKEEYELFQNSSVNTVTTPIRGSRTINWLKSWDYKGGLKEYTFKTLMKPPYEHPLIKVEECDMRPAVNMMFYKITITR
jgi:hypothetical protein